MLQALYNFFLPLFELQLDGGDYLWDIGLALDLGGDNWVTIYLDSYLALICSIISLVIIVTLCCLFIGKLVKGVAHLMVR